LELIANPRLKVLTPSHTPGQIFAKEIDPDKGGCNAPKRKKVLQDNPDFDGTKE